MTNATTPSRLEGRWTVDIERERSVIRSYLWSLRPSLLRWPFLVTLAAVSALLIVLIIATGSAWGWILANVLIALFALAIGLRVILILILRNGLLRAISSGTVVDVILDASGWQSLVGEGATTLRWGDYDRFSVWEGHVILTKTRKGSWLPRSILYAPLAAFGADAGYVPEFVALALSTTSSTGSPSTSSGSASS